MRSFTSAVVIALLWICGAGTNAALLAQNPPSKTFDVISVKRSPPPDGPMMIVTGAREGDRWRSTNSTLRLLIRQAFLADYPLDGQMVGGPAWMDSDRFDILATMPPGAAVADMQAMVRSMLVERFKLRTHREMRELPVYALVLARPDGRLGPQLKPLSVDCEALRAARVKGEAPPTPPRTPGGPPPDCFTGIGQFDGTTSIESGGMNIPGLASTLSRAAGRPVFDRTGLTGFFTVNLTFATEPASVSPLGGPPRGVSLDPVDAPSLTAAVVDQLGLRLESRREQMPVLVIDGAEPPSEN
jgi:uncharacterized protein (TIGR03435 family)